MSLRPLTTADPSVDGSTIDGRSRPLPTSVAGRNASMGELVLGVLARRFNDLIAHEPGARRTEDPEEIHDMRVATRRIRAVVGTFPSVVAEADRYRAEFGWLAAALGAVRDLDIEIDRISGSSARYGDALAPLQAVLVERRSAARAELLAVLASDRYGRLLSSFAEGIRDRSILGPGAAEPAASAVPPVVTRLWKRTRKRVRRLGPDPSAEALHRVRIRTKRVRYATEAAAELYGKPAAKLVRRLGRVQDALGARQDARVLVAQLHGFAADVSLDLPPTTLFAMGELAAETEWTARQQRDRFDRTFAKLTPAWKRLRRSMQQT
jgi:triphosphatase